MLAASAEGHAIQWSSPRATMRCTRAVSSPGSTVSPRRSNASCSIEGGPPSTAKTCAAWRWQSMTAATAELARAAPRAARCREDHRGRESAAPPGNALSPRTSLDLAVLPGMLLAAPGSCQCRASLRRSTPASGCASAAPHPVQHTRRAPRNPLAATLYPALENMPHSSVPPRAPLTTARATCFCARALTRSCPICTWTGATGTPRCRRPARGASNIVSSSALAGRCRSPSFWTRRRGRTRAGSARGGASRPRSAC